MRKYNLTIVILISLLCCYFITPTHSALTQSLNTPIQSQGIVTYNGHYGLTLKYSTDFEDVAKVDNWHLSISIDHSFRFQGEGGARMWMETSFARSGSKCVGMELTDITKSRRNEFNIKNMQNLVGQELYVSVWLYLPSDWALHAPDWNWYAIAQPSFDVTPTWLPYTEVHINQPNFEVEEFDVEVMGRDVDGNRLSIDTVENFPLPRGRWFNLEYYLNRRETNSEFKVWFDGQLISDRSDLTWIKFVDEYTSCIAKIYHSTSDTTPHQIWVDDLEIYGTP